MTEQINNKTKYLVKDLKRIIIISLIILIVLIALVIVNLKTNFLLELTEFLMTKFVG